MFALAILDERQHRLTLVRDRNGIKPLYWAHIGDTIYFASELKAILALIPERPALSSAALRAFLRWKYIPDPHTIFAGVHRLRRGEMLRATMGADSLSIERSIYWRPTSA
jgi:asparagine synthase (glutamine-hydrolysing)